uniref:hypothetical protein n=1 Tax=Streptococcus suis TaxID=1307 RepID=UPI000CF61E85
NKKIAKKTQKSIDIAVKPQYNIVKVKELTESKQEEKQMVDILKSLKTEDLGTVLIVLGLVREARLWHKQVLEHKRNLQNKD